MALERGQSKSEMRERRRGEGVASRATARHFALDERLFQVLDTQRIWDENVWTKAVHRVAAECISPEQAVDEAIARIKQILAE